MFFIFRRTTYLLTLPVNVNVDDIKTKKRICQNKDGSENVNFIKCLERIKKRFLSLYMKDMKDMLKILLLIVYTCNILEITQKLEKDRFPQL